MALWHVTVTDKSYANDRRTYYVEARDLAGAAKRAEKRAREDSMFKRPYTTSIEWLGEPIR